MDELVKAFRELSKQSLANDRALLELIQTVIDRLLILEAKVNGPKG